jgi:hypothetical protein
MTAWARAAADDHRGEGWVVLAQLARLSTVRRQWLFTKLLDGGRCVDTRCPWPRVPHLGVLAYRLSVARIGGLRPDRACNGHVA